MAKINSRRKGKTGELQVAHLFQAAGYKAERGCQHDGLSGHADVVGVPYIWIEVKWRETLDLEEAMKQAERDCLAYMERTGEYIIPIVIHKKNREAWKVTTRDMFWLEFYGALPFCVGIETGGLLTARFEDWLKVYKAYQEWRDLCY